MKKFISLSFLIFISLNLSITSQARGIDKEIARALKYELTGITRRLEASNGAYSGETRYHRAYNTAFYFKTMSLRILPYAEFKIPGITKLKIKVRFDFHWQRKPPVGWEKYKP